MASLRLLLGYNPKDIKPQRQTPRVSATPVTLPSNYKAAMATKKNQYQVPLSKVKRLPPISEEGSPRSTPRPLATVTLKRLPKPKQAFKPTTSKPVIPVRPMPRPKENTPPISPRTKESFPLSPIDVKHTLVDGLVADYLHYARYGHVIPMYEGTSASTCPCCIDRNRQNVRTLLGFPSDIKDPPRKYDRNSKIERKDYPELRSDAVLFPNSMYAKIKQEESAEPTESEKRLHAIALESQKRSWMNYQPLPYSSNYLNPEFNRPSAVTNFYEERPRKNHEYIAGQVIEADSDYKYAMNKLQRFAFDGSG